jgi:hypothetical protein
VPPTLPSPRITRLGWGRLEVEGYPAPFKDAKLFPGGAREWDWSETGTRHRPGVQPTDVRELVERGARVIVLSRGQLGRLHVRPDTLEWLDAREVTTHVRATGEAVDLYNRLTRLESVGALIHSTC